MIPRTNSEDGPERRGRKGHWARGTGAIGAQWTSLPSFIRPNNRQPAHFVGCGTWWNGTWAMTLLEPHGS